MGEYIDVIYLGKDTKNTSISQHPNGKYYKTQININGRNIWVYLIKENKPRYKRIKFEGSVPSLSIAGWYDLDDPEFGEEFATRGFDKVYSDNHPEYSFEHSEEEPKQSISLLEVQVPIPYEYEPSEQQTPFYQNFHKIRSEIGIKLFEMKKRYIMQERKRQFLQRLAEDEEKYPEIKLSNVMSQFDNEDREKAFSIYNKMIYCIMKGKYSYEDYITFMRNLPSVISNKGIVVSEGNMKKFENKPLPTRTTTFYEPSNVTLAGLCPKEREFANERKLQRFKNAIINIDCSTDSLLYLPLRELKPEDRGAYFKAPNYPSEGRAIGMIPEQIIVEQDDGEICIIPERNRGAYKIRRKASHDDDYDNR